VSCRSTAANNLPVSASFSAGKYPQRIRANTSPVFSSPRSRIRPDLLSFTMKRLLGQTSCRLLKTVADVVLASRPMVSYVNRRSCSGE
jgi:hypothetical protein